MHNLNYSLQLHKIIIKAMTLRDEINAIDHLSTLAKHGYCPKEVTIHRSLSTILKVAGFTITLWASKQT